MNPKPPDILRKSHRHAERDERATAKLALRRELAEVGAEAALPGHYHGGCACGAIGYVYSTRVVPSEWPIRRCSCEFCARFDALYAFDPAGSIELCIDDVSQVARHRIDRGTAEFLSCRRCGEFVAAVTHGETEPRAIVNLRLLDNPPPLPALEPEPPDADATGDRHDKPNWTPLARSR